MKERLINYQGGDHTWNRGTFRHSLSYVKKADLVLDIGSGIKFLFPKMIADMGAKPSCVDILRPEEIPDFIEDFYQQNVEKEFDLKKKFDVVTALEIIEHLDKTDELIKNCIRHTKENGLIIIACPNMASLWGRLELLLGFQPHVTEISNEFPNVGTGLFGKINNPYNEKLHRLRGMTTRGTLELLKNQGLEVVKVIGHYENAKLLGFVFSLFSSIAPVNIFICKKKAS